MPSESEGVLAVTIESAATDLEKWLMDGPQEKAAVLDWLKELGIGKKASIPAWLSTAEEGLGRPVMA